MTIEISAARELVRNAAVIEYGDAVNSNGIVSPDALDLALSTYVDAAKQAEREQLAEVNVHQGADLDFVLLDDSRPFKVGDIVRVKVDTSLGGCTTAVGSIGTVIEIDAYGDNTVTVRLHTDGHGCNYYRADDVELFDDTQPLQRGDRVKLSGKSFFSVDMTGKLGAYLRETVNGGHAIEVDGDPSRRVVTRQQIERIGRP